MAQTGPLTSVADAHRRARRRLPRPVYFACIGGRGYGTVIRRKREDLENIVSRSHVWDEPEDLNLETRIMGQHLSMPLLLSPIGAQALRPDAEAQAAHAAQKAGTTFGLSNVASQGLPEVLRANPNTLAQLYWGGPKDEILERVHRYRDQGAAGLIVTLDWSKGPGTDWDPGKIPAKVNLKAMAQFAPAVAPYPTWLLTFLLRGQLPTLHVPQFGTRENPNPTFVEALDAIESTTQPTWQDVAWIKEEFGGPVMAKGIFDPDDARRAIDAGVDAISVSNHGGNTVDEKQSAISALPTVAKAVNGQVDVLMDGGVRRGSDVVKAMALGADAVMLGRAYLWALIARGEVGVSEILQIFKDGIKQSLRTVRVESVHDLGPEHVITPHQPRYWELAPTEYTAPLTS